MSLFSHHKSSIHFQQPEEGGDGLRQMIEDERNDNNAIDLFAPETGEELQAYLDGALAMGGVAINDARDQES